MGVPPGKTTFTLQEAAELLSCHRETLRKAILDGDLKAAKLGRDYRVSRPELAAYWAACGGGELFESPALSDEADAAETPPSPKGARKKKTPGRNDRQLSLLGSLGKADPEQP